MKNIISVKDLNERVNALAKMQVELKHVTKTKHNDTGDSQHAMYALYVNKWKLFVLYTVQRLLKVHPSKRDAIINDVISKCGKLIHNGYINKPGGKYSVDEVKKDINELLRVLEQDKLYVLVSSDLEPMYGAVQGGHAIAEYLLHSSDKQWQNGRLIFLKCDRIKLWKNKLERFGITHFPFYESDLNNNLTAIAVHCDGRIFRKLKLLSHK